MDDKLIPGLLVAMPNLQDPYFQKSVILLCEFNSESAFGVVINRPSSVMIRDIFVEDVPIKTDQSLPVLVGGPVQPEFLWAIHSNDLSGEHSTRVNNRFSLTPVQELIGVLTEDLSPKHLHLGCGYAGWGPGQLDQELREGAWWLTPLSDHLILDMDYGERWEAALKTIGLDPQLTSFPSTGEA